MPGNRIGRINEEIQRELAAQIRRLKDPRVNGVGMVSVTRTDVTHDLRYCKVYISVLDKARERDALKGLKSAAGFLRRELGRELRLRYTPELQFEADDSILRGAHVLEILRNVEYAEDAEGTEDAPEGTDSAADGTAETPDGAMDGTTDVPEGTETADGTEGGNADG